VVVCPFLVKVKALRRDESVQEQPACQVLQLVLQDASQIASGTKPTSHSFLVIVMNLANIKAGKG